MLHLLTWKEINLGNSYGLSIFLITKKMFYYIHRNFSLAINSGYSFFLVSMCAFSHDSVLSLKITSNLIIWTLPSRQDKISFLKCCPNLLGLMISSECFYTNLLLFILYFLLSNSLWMVSSSVFLNVLTYLKSLILTLLVKYWLYTSMVIFYI